MKTLIAKPIVKDQYWVVTDGDKKVGNVVASGTGIELIMNGINTKYDNESDLKKKHKIDFQTIKTNKTKPNLPISNYPTTNKVFNSMLDIKKKLLLYTKTSKSKCYYAAGYFVINQHGFNEVVFCPKYIFIQRYKYYGPFKTEQEAKDLINSL
jgi:hypothetical protein